MGRKNWETFSTKIDNEIRSATVRCHFVSANIPRIIARKVPLELLNEDLVC